MNNKLLFLRVTFALFLLIGCGAFMTQSNSAGARTCESERWTAFLNANTSYTSAFRLWYYSDPTSCYQLCNTQCQNDTNPNCESECQTNCQNERLRSFRDAQDALVRAANRFCPPELDFCGEARARETLCRNTQITHLQDPVHDPNSSTKEVDSEWLSDVTDEYVNCRAASGVDNCE